MRKSLKVRDESCNLKVVGLDSREKLAGHMGAPSALVLLFSGQHSKAVVVLCRGQTRTGKVKFTYFLWQTAGGTGNSVGRDAG